MHFQTFVERFDEANGSGHQEIKSENIIFPRRPIILEVKIRRDEGIICHADPPAGGSASLYNVLDPKSSSEPALNLIQG